MSNTTNCIVIGNVIINSTTPIEFIYQLEHSIEGKIPAINPSVFKPNQYKNVELIKASSYFMVETRMVDDDNVETTMEKNAYEYDLMLAYDDSRTDGTLHIGFWNDGVV